MAFQPLRQIAGSTGKAIDAVGSKLPWQNQQGTSFGGVDWSSTLQNWGGNTAGSIKDAIVRPAYASEGEILGYNNDPRQNRSEQTMSTAPVIYPQNNPNPSSGGSQNSSGGNSGGNQGGGFNDNIYNQYYAGWDRGAAAADWAATGGSKANQGGGGGQSAPDIFGNIQSKVDELLGYLPQQQEAMTQKINSIYDPMKQGITEQYNAGVGQLDQARENARIEQERAYKDLESSFFNQGQSLNNMLGTRGASDSSAARLASEALSRDFARNRTSINRQTQDAMSEIDMQLSNLGMQRDQALQQVEADKAQQLAQLESDFQDRINMLRQQGLDISVQEQQMYLNQLLEIENRARTWQDALIQRSMEHMSQLNDYKVQLGQLGNYNPQDLVMQELNAFGPMANQAADITNAVFGRRFNDEK